MGGDMTKRILEICASFTGKIETGQYQNASPFFSVKEVIDEGDFPMITDSEIMERQKQLHKMCVDQFNKAAEILYQEKVAKAYKQIRFYDAGDGLKVPSVTSIINMDADFFVSPDELAQYGARGTVIHKQIELFLKDGQWREPKDIPEVAYEVMTVLKGTLGLSLEDVNFPAFYKDYPFLVIDQEKEVVNKEYKFGGRLDILCTIPKVAGSKWDKIEGIQFDTPTILDVKTSTTLDKVKGFSQQAAYSLCYPNVKQIGLIHLNKDNMCGYSKPVISNKLEAYQAIFLKQRQLFADRYGV